MSIFRWLTLSVHIARFNLSPLAVHKSAAVTTPHAISTRDATMPYLTHPIAARAPFVRTVAIAALMGATFLAAPLTATRALAQAAATFFSNDATATETK